MLLDQREDFGGFGGGLGMLVPCRKSRERQRVSENRDP
jgi:hypothetical protein